MIVWQYNYVNSDFGVHKCVLEIDEHLTMPLFSRNYLHILTLIFLHDYYLECSEGFWTKEKREFFKIERECDFLILR